MEPDLDSRSTFDLAALKRENRMLADKLLQAEKGKSEALGNLKAAQQALNYFKQQAFKVESLGNPEKLAQELSFLRKENSQVLFENKTIRAENLELQTKKRILEEEVERLNGIIYQMESATENSVSMVKRPPRFEEKPLDGNRSSVGQLRSIDSEDYLEAQLSRSTYSTMSPTHRHKLSETHISNMKRLASQSLSTKNSSRQFAFPSPKPQQPTSSSIKLKTGSLADLKHLIKLTQQIQRDFNPAKRPSYKTYY